MGKRLLISGLLALMIFSSYRCQKEFGPQAVNGSPVRPDSSLAVIVNEGNFQWGNASLGQFNPETGRYEDGLYQQANNQALGDVIQEAHQIEGRYYLVMNGSNELIICDKDWQSLSRSPGLGAPKQLWYWRQSLWLSDLYQAQLQRFNRDGDLQGNIPLEAAPLSLSEWQGKLIIAYPRKITALQADEQSLINLKQFPQPLKALLSYGQDLFLAFENQPLQRWAHPDSSLKSLGSHQPKILAFAPRPDGGGFYSFDGDSLYFHSQVEQYRAEGLMAISCENFYGLDFHAASESLYLFDARAFVQPHRVRRINLNTKEVSDDFEAGALPNGLLRKW